MRRAFHYTPFSSPKADLRTAANQPMPTLQLAYRPGVELMQVRVKPAKLSQGLPLSRTGAAAQPRARERALTER
jgi:hypothetical protein